MTVELPNPWIYKEKSSTERCRRLRRDPDYDHGPVGGSLLSCFSPLGLVRLHASLADGFDVGWLAYVARRFRLGGR